MPHRNTSAFLGNPEVGLAIDNIIAIAAGIVAVVTVVAFVGFIGLKDESGELDQGKLLGRYGLVFTAFLLFTSLLRHEIIGTDTYMTLAAGALGAVGGYQFHKRGHEQAKGDRDRQQPTDEGEQQPRGGTGDGRPPDGGEEQNGAGEV